MQKALRSVSKLVLVVLQWLLVLWGGISNCDRTQYLQL
jgi:hypothetical protein